MSDGFPIGMGYFAVSFSLGILAAKAGLTAWMGFVGSFLTRASAGEYGVYSLIAIGASYVEVVAMCLVTNLRYLLMSTALTQKFASNVSLLKRILVACCVTDEIFGISIAYPGNLPPAYPFGAMLVSTTMWASGTAVGIVAGEILPPHVVAALSVALYGMFIAIIIPRSHPYLDDIIERFDSEINMFRANKP
jgi:predicted branched-subunit amino acid permease